MDIKIVFAFLSSLVGIISFFPYFVDIFKGRTKPHLFTWLIWSTTQGIATAGILFGNGKWGALELGIGTLFIFLIFLFSFKSGSKDVTKADVVTLLLALIAIVIWAGLKQPLLSVILVTLIDLIGIIPTLRKSYSRPESETLVTWIGFVLANVLALAALHQYNGLTVIYLLCTALIDSVLSVMLYTRRHKNA